MRPDRPQVSLCESVTTRRSRKAKRQVVMGMLIGAFGFAISFAHGLRVPSCLTRLTLRGRARSVSMNAAEVPVKVLSASNEATPYANMWCAPWFKLDEVGPASTRQDLGTARSAFFLNNVISAAEAARMVAVADSMGFERAADAEKERQNGALSWVLHAELELQLLKRLVPHLPWTIAIHAPGTPAPTLESSGGAPPWIRLVEGAPTGEYVLAGLSARSRVYRYESDGKDAFQAHYDEVWPGSRLEIGVDGCESKMRSDGWKYSSAARGQWAWSAGDRISHLSVLLYLTDDFDGGETLLHLEGEELSEEAASSSNTTTRSSRRRCSSSSNSSMRVAVTPITGSALCFGQSFKLGRTGVSHSADALLHEGMPLGPLDGMATRPLFMKPPAKYVLRTDVQYTMPTPPTATHKAADGATSNLNDPQAAQSMTIELSEDQETRAQQLELLKSHGYDVSPFERLSP